MKKKIKFLIKLTLTLTLIYFVFSKIDLQSFKETLKGTNLFWHFLAFVAFNISKIISSVRLNYYFKDLKLTLSEKKNLMLYYVGMFYNLFLPGGIGGGGYKIYLLHKIYKKKIKHLISATLLDRVSGVIALSFFASILFLFSSFVTISDIISLLSLIFALTIFPLYIFIHKRFFYLFDSYIKKTTLLALVVQFFQILTALFLVYSINDNGEIDYLTLFLISSIVASLPLTIGGVGAREFTFLYGFEIIHRDTNMGVAFSILFFIITALSSLIGIFFLHKVSK